MQRIYLDANATTPLLSEVFEAMRPFWIEHFGNASSIHQQGQYARAAVEQARDTIAHMLHCRASEIVFTSGGTESDNLALFGILNQPRLALSEPYHLITTNIEHHAVLHAAHQLEKQAVQVTYLQPDSNGVIQPTALLNALRPNTRLVSVMLANNETGVIQPIIALAAITKAAGAIFHTDAVQGAGKLPMDLSPHGELRDVDLLAISGHKMYAPQGTGVLFVRRSIRLAPLFYGGTHERQRRAGTENVAGIVALGKASEIAQQWLAEDNPVSGPTQLANLRNRLEQGLLATVEACGINGIDAPRTANTSSLYFDHLEAEALVIALDLKGISVSGGSACQSGAAEPSHVLSSMGLSPARARATIRISLSRHTTEAEIDTALTIIPTAVARLRELSPSYHKETMTVA